MRLASVILDIPTQSLDAPYTYEAPLDLVNLEVGCAVLVPFGNRQAIGYVIKLEEIDGDTNEDEELERRGLLASKLKSIQELLSQSYFNEQGAACARFLSETYIAPLSTCVRLFTPPGGVPRMVHTGKYWRVEKPAIGPVDDRWVRLGPGAEDYKPKKTAVKQSAILSALSQGELRVAELSMEFGAVSQVLKTLAAKNVVVIEQRRRMRGTKEEISKDFVASDKPPLTQSQENALTCISEVQLREAGEVILVDGVTGSGKTELYLQAIEKTLSQGQTAIVLVPEISLTPQTVARFRGRFGDRIAVMHSRMSIGERYDQWDRIRLGQAQIVIGARSALFTPVSQLGLIIIDEEHEGSYKQDSAPRYVARDLAAWMVREHQATLILGSATPSIETLFRCEKWDSWHHIRLPERVNNKPLPPIEVVDMAQVFSSGDRSMFSQTLVKSLYEVIDAGQKAVLLLNQRGFAKFLLCRDCGYVPQCPSCSLSLTFHERGNTLVCHHCGYSERAPALCPECSSPYLKKFGAGTQRVEAELRSILEAKEAVVIRMDSDTTSKKGSHQRLLEEFAEADSAVLLGTQMIAKGLDYDDVTLVGVINADTMLKLPDFRSNERTFNLIEQVAGRAGRAHLPGKVIVQTYLADAPAIRAAAYYDRSSFLKNELPKRKALGYPPYKRLANVLIWGKDEALVKHEAEELYKQIEKRIYEMRGDTWTCLPANPCVLSKLRNAFRYHILIKAPPDDKLSEVLLPLFRGRKAQTSVNVTVDIDPDDLL